MVFGDVRLPVEVGKVGARVLVLAVHEQLRANQSLPPKNTQPRADFEPPTTCRL